VRRLDIPLGGLFRWLAAFLIFGLGSGRLCWSISRVKPFTVRMQMPIWVQSLGIYIPVLYCLTCLSCHYCVDKSSEINDVFIPSIRLDDNHYSSNPPFSFFLYSFLPSCYTSHHVSLTPARKRLHITCLPLLASRHKSLKLSIQKQSQVPTGLSHQPILKISLPSPPNQQHPRQAHPQIWMD